MAEQLVENHSVAETTTGKNNQSQKDLAFKIAKILLVIIIFFLIFSLGVLVGETKARFSFHWLENYPQNFAGPRQGFLNNWQQLPFPSGEILEAHGTFGKIIKINTGDFVVEGRDNLEKVIQVSDKTIIRSFRNINASLQITDLKIGDYVMVIGSSNNQGQIDAQFIRVLNTL
ncbi:MAG: hypothetical protein ACP5RX_02255 [Minisyncoccia bacterium]